MYGHFFGAILIGAVGSVLPSTDNPVPQRTGKDSAAAECIKEIVTPIIGTAAFRWNKENTVTAIQALHAAGIALNTASIMADESDETTQVITRALNGRVTTGRALYTAGTRQFVSWSKALQAAGLDPDAVKLNTDWTPARVLTAIKALHAAGLPLNTAAIVGPTPETTAKILRAVLGLPPDSKKLITTRKLYSAASMLFSTWADALVNAGLSAGDHRLLHTWSADQIVKAIQALNGKIELNTNSISGDFSNETKAAIKAAVGFEATGCALYGTGISHYGSWNEALRAAGLDPEEVRVHATWNQQRIIDVLKALDGKFPLQHTLIRDESSEAFGEILKGVLGRAATGNALLKAADWHFGSWKEALVAAGIKVEALKRQPVWTNEIVIKSLQLFDNSELASTVLRLDMTEATRDRLEPLTGRRSTGAHLHAAAVRLFGSYEAALLAAGRDPTVIRKMVVWEKKAITEFIKELRGRRLPLSVTGLLLDTSKELAELIRAHFGLAATAAKFVGAATGHFGNWVAAMDSAGIGEKETRLLSRWDTDTVIEAIRALRKAGISLEERRISHDLSSATREVIEPIVGRRVSGRELFLIGSFLFKDWHEAVSYSNASGVALTREQIISVIRALDAEGVNLDLNFAKWDFRRGKELAQKVLGKEIEFRDLYVSAWETFGSWRNALRHNGVAIKPRAIDATNVRADQAKIIAAIQLLRRMGINLTPSRLQFSPEATAPLKEIMGKEILAVTLIQSAQLAFGSWENAIRAAGLNPREVFLRWRWLESEVLACVLAFSQRGVNLRRGSLTESKSTSIREILLSIVHRAETGKTLALAGEDYFGTWEAGLARVGLNPDGSVPRLTLPEPEMAQAFKELHEARIPLSELDLTTDTSDPTLAILKRIFKRGVTAAQLYHAARRLTELPWEETLKHFKINLVAARDVVKEKGRFGPGLGLDRRPRLSATAEILTREKIKQVILALNDHEVALNVGALTFDKSERTGEVLQELCGKAVSGSQLINQAKAEFGSWDEALRFAGLNPADIRKRTISRRGDAVLIPTQSEGSGSGDDYRNMRYVGRPPEKPDAEVERGEFTTLLEQAVKNLDTDVEKKLASVLIEFILASAELADHQGMAEVAAGELGRAVSVDEVKVLLGKLAWHPAFAPLREELFGDR